MPPMLNATNANKRADKIAATPLRRLGKPIEVSYGLLFLASDEASFGTGTELVIDVGYIASRPGAMPNIDTRRISLFSRLPGAAEFLSCSCTNLAAAAKAGARLPRFKRVTSRVGLPCPSSNIRFGSRAAELTPKDRSG
jgi:Enoyl-(Acyl carrier protein) reductase